MARAEAWRKKNKVTLAPKLVPTPAAQTAEERFAIGNQPTEALADQYVRVANPFYERLREERIAQSKGMGTEHTYTHTLRNI